MKDKLSDFFKRLCAPTDQESYKKGMEYFNNYQYKKAIATFEKVLQKKLPESNLDLKLSKFYCSQAYRNFGIMEFAKGNNMDALSHFTMALNLNRNQADIYYLIGICHNNLGNFKEAVSIFNKILKMDLENISVRQKLAISFHNLEMWDEAEKINRQILEKKPGYADVNFRMGLVLIGKREIEQASIFFKKAVEINPNYINARLKLAVTLVLQNKLEEAFSNIYYIIDKKLEYADVYYTLGLIHDSANDMPQAIASTKKAVQINPTYKKAKIKLILLYLRANNFEKAFKEMHEASKLFPDDNRLTNACRTISVIKSHKNQNMTDMVDKAKRLFGEEKSLTSLLGEFNRNLDITPKFSEMLSSVSSKDSSQGDVPFAKAIIPVIEDYIDKFPTYPDLHNNLGLQLLMLKRFDEAINSFNEAVRLNPNYFQARINLLRTLTQNQYFSEAVAHGEFLCAQNFPYPDIYCIYAKTMLGLKQYDKALSLANQATSIRNGYIETNYIRGKVFEALGKTDEAVKEYNICLGASSKSPIHEKAQKALKRLSK